MYRFMEMIFKGDLIGNFYECVKVVENYDVVMIDWLIILVVVNGFGFRRVCLVVRSVYV